MNWPFFTCTARPVFAAATNRSVWWRQECGDLQQVDRFGDFHCLVRFVQIGSNRQAKL